MNRNNKKKILEVKLTTRTQITARKTAAQEQGDVADRVVPCFSVCMWHLEA